MSLILEMAFPVAVTVAYCAYVAVSVMRAPRSYRKVDHE